ncbi:methyl-accepting chemotaxis protein [Desulfosporosinus sp. FKB]|uniref:methyl-accepting chemotaxis protein n=1 Tax=Desulfosporosinus sp. FKB TaxID=1969835 RepID=UPI000B4A3214|nr:methyl-accepting chemotaxis protein [Desulfosporosinus sp. FKB]
MKTKYLPKFIEIMPILAEITRENMTIVVHDLVKETILACETAKTLPSTAFKIGDSFKLEDRPAFRKVKKENKQIAAMVPNNFFGVPIKLILTPVEDETGAVVAAIAIYKGIEKEEKINGISSILHTSIEQLSAGIEEIASNSQELASFIKEIVDFSSQTQNNIGGISNIVRGIKNISSQSNLLTLNASIEAARAGDAGRGFSVVAKEMGKLSNLSKDSSDKVEKSLLNVKEAIETIARQIVKTSLASDNQAATTEQIAATIDDILGVTKQLSDMARIDTMGEALGEG